MSLQGVPRGDAERDRQADRRIDGRRDVIHQLRGEQCLAEGDRFVDTHALPLESELVLGDSAGERCKLESPALPMTEPYYLPIGDEVEVFTAAYTKRLQP